MRLITFEMVYDLSILLTAFIMFGVDRRDLHKIFYTLIFLISPEAKLKKGFLNFLGELLIFSPAAPSSMKYLNCQQTMREILLSGIFQENE